MSRTFLIFLMIGTALMIAVIGGQRESRVTGHMPWEVNVLDDGKVRAFGITLGKTQIQDANQILASFPEVRLVSDENNQYKLMAIYDDLNIGGFIAKLELQYELDEQQLAELQTRATAIADTNYYKLASETEMGLLTHKVTALVYKPSIDYDMDMILQRFGQPDEELKINDHLQKWSYQDQGLDILINSQGLDEFHYHPIVKAATQS